MRMMNILRQLIADERVLGPSWLVEREGHASVVQGLADEVAALGRNVGVFFAEDLCDVVSQTVLWLFKGVSGGKTNAP